MNVLSQLTVVGNVTKEQFETQFDQMFPSLADVYYIVVIVDKNLDKIVGSATLIIERKFVRSTGLVSQLLTESLLILRKFNF